jgi:1-acyl-sn-glycerol-3-phosphate acyltransferase
MRLTHTLVTGGIKGILRVLCRIDASQMARIPSSGPLILVANHISSLEVPIIYTQLQPRPATALAKAETWEHPLFGPLASIWDAIPLHRGEADAEAFRLALEALAQGRILAVAPEGTRSHGQLQRGLPGVVLLALRSKAPLMPMVYYGHESFRENLRRLRRTDFHVVVGDPFVVDPGAGRVDAERRQAIVDEMMVRLALLLPSEYRGVYAEAVNRAPIYTRTISLESLTAARIS